MIILDNLLKDNLIDHYKEKAPYNWSLIKKRISQELVADLLKSLEDFSDPQGKELIDFRGDYLSKINKKNRIGA